METRKIAELPGSPTVDEVAKLIQYNGLANTASKLDITPADLDKIRKEYGIEFSKTVSAGRSFYREAQEGLTPGQWIGAIMFLPYALYVLFTSIGKNSKKVKQILLLFAIAFLLGVLRVVASR